MTKRNLVATVAFICISIGFWIERPSLGLIVPGSLVFGCLAWSHNAQMERKQDA